ncbi:MAG: RNA ligase (ATP) [Planctomycetes bacterium]|nr:RNA ligase (ATP) [Planctomycetota bacterium]
MSTALIVPVALIEEVKPHSNADRLEIARILGWQVVVPKGQHRAGQKVVYFPPDAVLPPEVSDRFGVTQYLSKGRVRCARLRGEASFGFVVPPDDPDWPLGMNVAERYGAVKFEPPPRPDAGDSERAHPLFQRYTDIENLRNFPHVLQPGEPVVVTEKIHGTSGRIGIVEGEWMAGSMGVRRKRPPDEKLPSSTYWWPYALPELRALVESLAGAHRQVVLYGEVYGAKIQSFHYGLHKSWGFAAFDLLVDGRFLDWPDFLPLCERFAVPRVPVLYEGPYDIEVVRRLSCGKTTFEDAHVREGVVVKPQRERLDPVIGRVALKDLRDEYLLDEKKTDYTEL